MGENDVLQTQLRWDPNTFRIHNYEVQLRVTYTTSLSGYIRIVGSVQPGAARTSPPRPAESPAISPAAGVGEPPGLVGAVALVCAGDLAPGHREAGEDAAHLSGGAGGAAQRCGHLLAPPTGLCCAGSSVAPFGTRTSKSMLATVAGSSCRIPRSQKRPDPPPLRPRVLRCRHLGRDCRVSI
jgi:hypothetical protein